MLIDTHSHLFLEEFAEDLPQVMERARNAGVSSIFMPNIDSTTIDALLSVCAKYPDLCYPMIGLHPTSVNETYEQELAIVRERLSAPNHFVAIGEIGLDLYWDRTFLKEQLLVFERQIEWALEYELPVVIHTREAFDYIYKVMEPYKKTALRGIFHSFTGTPEELIQTAVGHVGAFWEKDSIMEQGLHITARINTSQGIRCRAVADKLPAYVKAVEPSLEDAYLYLISREAAQ